MYLTLFFKKAYCCLLKYKIYATKRLSKINNTYGSYKKNTPANYYRFECYILAMFILIERNISIIQKSMVYLYFSGL